MIEQGRHTRQSNETDQRSKVQQIVSRVYSLYFGDIKFREIDYIIGDAPANMAQVDPLTELCDVVYLIDDCLVYTEKGFDTLYNHLLSTVRQPKQPWAARNRAADILVTMNGQNEKVYNLKKAALQTMKSLECKQQQGRAEDQSEDWQQLDIGRQLQINSAVIMKFKKTSSCYEYRYWLVQHQLQSADHEQVGAIHSRESELQMRILNRFPRNYFCWMYRLRLFKLLCSISNDAAISSAELASVHEMLERSPNDYSALSYYRHLLHHCRQLNFQQSLKQAKQRVNKLWQFCKIAYEEPASYQHLTDLRRELLQANELNKQID